MGKVTGVCVEGRVEFQSSYRNISTYTVAAPFSGVRRRFTAIIRIRPGDGSGQIVDAIVGSEDDRLAFGAYYFADREHTIEWAARKGYDLPPVEMVCTVVDPDLYGALTDAALKGTLP